MAEINTIAVVGAGFMGAGIAQLAAQKGFAVRLVDSSPQRLNTVLEEIAGYVQKLSSKHALQEPVGTVMRRIRKSTSLEAAAEADAVLEAIPEKVRDKQVLFEALENICPKSTLFGSNTSTIPIRLLAESTNRPEQVVGTHFFFPVPLNPLLEIIPTEHTRPEVLESFLELGARLGKFNVLVKKDVPGFIMNRIFGALTCEAISLVERGVATINDIDTGLTVGYGMLQGPLAKADMAGLDVCLMAFQNIADMDGSISPPDLLKRLVAEGKLGRKSGEGFYRYDNLGKVIAPAF